ncbi:putative bifunctional diguanylate cyclase/phosphodiesterase [Roseovarius sp. 2305UL8-3]|uniref:putative bifunctional diguanylate cyclase/phosphodiesterase n=1 Tax=Roseovarius conchicola TaxID=3121636 RepID=UPI003528F499
MDQATFGLILNRVRDGIVVQDMQGRIEWINPACEAMYGWNLKEVRGRRPIDFLIPAEDRPPPDQIEQFRYDPESALFRQFKISQHIRRDGSRFWNQQSYTLLDMGPKESDKKVVITCRDVTDQVHTETALRQVQVDLEHAAHHDDLTGLGNRKKLCRFLDTTAIRARISRHEIGVLQLDIDKFKDINDTLGHAAGDATLVHVAQALRAHCAPDDLACRTGGDEFLLICPGIASRNQLIARAETLHDAIQSPLQWTSQVIEVGTSIGASLPERPGTSGEELIQMADQALYAAKDRGRGQVVFYTARIGQAQKSQIQMARDLRIAVVREQFEVYLQPQLSLSQNRIVACEALLRWLHPERGLLLPGDFLCPAERNGVLAEIDYISMNLALDALVALREAGFGDLRMALNVSSSILADVNYPGLLDWALQSRGLEPDDICVEILETTIFERAGLDVTTAINRLKRLGVRVALDDFGTGYAGLAHMAAFDIDAIKLDGSMIGRLETDPRNRAVVRSIIRLSALLGMQVVAEGVETQSQLDILRRTSCSLIQGFGLARPMPVDKMIDWLRQNTPLANPLPFGMSSAKARVVPARSRNR